MTFDLIHLYSKYTKVKRPKCTRGFHNFLSWTKFIVSAQQYFSNSRCLNFLSYQCKAKSSNWKLDEKRKWDLHSLGKWKHIIPRKLYRDLNTLCLLKSPIYCHSKNVLDLNFLRLSLYLSISLFFLSFSLYTYIIKIELHTIKWVDKILSSQKPSIQSS